MNDPTWRTSNMGNESVDEAHYVTKLEARIEEAYVMAKALTKCRSTACVMTKLDEAAMWLEAFKAKKTPTGGPS